MQPPDGRPWPAVPGEAILRDQAAGQITKSALGTEPYDKDCVGSDMDDPTTLRRKAAQFLKCASAATIADEAEKLNEVGRQLELWANELEEMRTHADKGSDRSEPGKPA